MATTATQAFGHQHHNRLHNRNHLKRTLSLPPDAAPGSGSGSGSGSVTSPSLSKAPLTCRASSAMSPHIGMNGWQPPGGGLAGSGSGGSSSFTNSLAGRPLSGPDDGPAAGVLRRTTTMTPVDLSLQPSAVPDTAPDAEEESRRRHFAELYRKSEARITDIFASDGSYDYVSIEALRRPPPAPSIPPATGHAPIREPPLKRARRTINEDDYDDDDDDDDDDDNNNNNNNNDASSGQNDMQSFPKSRSSHPGALLSPSKSGSSPVHSITSPGKPAPDGVSGGGAQALSKTSEDARKQLEQDRTATERMAQRSFWTLIHTLENDRTAMLEQQQLEESEKQLQAEMENNGGSGVGATGAAGASQAPGHGSLASANLGASSLTLKHLIARIDAKRGQVQASDAELRLLMNEVRKNRSKWASEENVNQEELYEALDKVLTDLKAHTEYSTPFLQRVNKRDAPDYYNFIKQPMDLGSMTKKLKGLQYKSKADFVLDLNLIWDNCLRYNQDMNHPLRRLANGMRKEAELLIPLIPDLAIRSRAEVEAEERRKQNGGDDGADDDSDDEPIMSSRGRTAGKGINKSRQTAPAGEPPKEETPAQEQKPALQLNGLLKLTREGSETAVDGSAGFATPPIGGSNTPGPVNGNGNGNGTTASAVGSNADAMDIDGPSLNGMALGRALGEAARQVYEDDEYKMWKQVTKKDRALVTRERSQLFREDGKLNPDAPALLRTRAGLRSFLKARKNAEVQGFLQGPASESPAQGELDASAEGVNDGSSTTAAAATAAAATVASTKPTETLAEGMEGEAERAIPYYYEPLNLVPDINPRLRWEEDGEGGVINQHEEYLRLVPRGHFTAPDSKFAQKMEANIRRIQETRKLTTKIAVVKQMQVQTQVYANQFPRLNMEPFVEQDIDPHFTSDGGPVIAPQTCCEALKRTVAKIVFATGFEELQPSAVDALTGIASDYFWKLTTVFKEYAEADKREATGAAAEAGARYQPRFTAEEVVLHTLHESGTDLNSLEAYVRDDVDRLSSKLDGIHERMKHYLAEVLRPALTADASADGGAGAFNDGSEQFVSGDFAEDLGEDFFGFRELGLDRDLGLDMMSVPLHLLQVRVRNQYQSQVQATGAGDQAVELLSPLPPAEPVTRDYAQRQIGLVRDFFLQKLEALPEDGSLVEDEELPFKQRRPRPRLGNTGKIVSPQKRPPKEQIALAKKRKKLEMQAAEQAKLALMNGVTNGGSSSGKGEEDGAAGGSAGGGAGGAGGGAGSVNTTPHKKMRTTNDGGVGILSAVGTPGPVLNLAAGAPMERTASAQSIGAMSGTGTGTDGMMSPESMNP